MDINTEIRKNAKNDSEKDFFKLMNNAVFPETRRKKHVRKSRDNKLLSTEAKKNY